MMNIQQKDGNKSTINKSKRQSLWKDVWKRLKKNKGAMAGLIFLIILATVTLLSGFIYDYEEDIIKQDISQALEGPSLKHPFGTDQFGRDIFARVIYGGRYSLPIGFLAVLYGLIIGVILGSIAGFYGGLVEEIIMRINDIIVVIPSFLLMIIIIATLGISLVNLVLAIGIATITRVTRLTRATVLSVRDQEYIEAARAIGAKNSHIIKSHIIPNCFSPILVQATIRVSNSIITASSLSFLGIGIQPPRPEWGTLLSAGRNYIRDHSYMTLFPGLAISLTVIAVNLLSDGLRDALDPKLKY